MGYPITKLLRHIFANQKNLTTLMNEVVNMDLESQIVELKHNTLNYDCLIVALGASTGYFGNVRYSKTKIVTFPHSDPSGFKIVSNNFRPVKPNSEYFVGVSSPYISVLFR